MTVAGYGRSGDGERGIGAPFGVPSGRKRAGDNQIDRVNIAGKTLQFDFDVGDKQDGAPNKWDRLGGPDYGLAGLAKGTIIPGFGVPPGANIPLPYVGSVDIGTAPGDSGGPYFLGGLIAGVHDGSDGEKNPVGATNGWGTISTGARVSAYYDNFIVPVTKNGRTYGAGGVDIDPADQKYDLVFDMTYQVYGRSGRAGAADKTPDNLTITALRAGDQLQIWVDNLDNPGPFDPATGKGDKLNGLY